MLHRMTSTDPEKFLVVCRAEQTNIENNHHSQYRHVFRNTLPNVKEYFPTEQFFVSVDFMLFSISVFVYYIRIYPIYLNEHPISDMYDMCMVCFI